jgi:hypothetical protein
MGKRLVVSKHGKLAPLYYVPEMSNASINRKQLSVKSRVLLLGWLQFLGKET